MSGSCQNPTAQSNVKITSIHTLLCRFQGHHDVMKVKFMVECTSMKVCYHKSIPLITCKNGNLYTWLPSVSTGKKMHYLKIFRNG